MKIALLGDSIFDNKAYVGNEPDVVAHLSTLAPDGWTVDLYAVDGSLVQDVPHQLMRLANQASHVIISAGGNNAILNADVLQMKASSFAEVLCILSDRAEDFERLYNAMLNAVVHRNLPTAVCTIYYPNFGEPLVQRIAVTALSIFNDVIIRQASLHKIPLLDLRFICNEADDYANEIEPSGKGGRKIAAAIIRMLEEHEFSHPRTQIYF